MDVPGSTRLRALGARVRLLVVVSVVLGGTAAWGVLSRNRPPTDNLAGLPSVMLWAWERPEDLRFLDPSQAGVVVLAGTVLLHGNSTEVRPRMQPLRAAPGTTVIPVVRVESDRAEPPKLTESQRAAAGGAILRLTTAAAVPAIQIDFDAVVSERDFYAGLIRDLRQRLPKNTRISITALASWCLGDSWIAGLPIDEAVPMLFQMGPDEADVHRLLRARGDFSIEVCRNSLGLSTGEPLSRRLAGRRTYVFHPSAWDEAAATRAIKEAATWR
jgi:hypothetical protein